jgi:uncharacterized protein (TIGR02186 family)
MNKTSFVLLLIVFLLLALPWLPRAQSAGEDDSMTVDPDHIKIGTFYHGTDVNITADIPLCEGVVVKIESEGKEVVLNRKAKIGFIWMNVAKVTVEGAPEVYVLASSDEVAAICSPGERERLGIGLETLESSVSFSSEKPLTGKEFRDFLKLKKHAGTYNDNISIVLEPAGDGRQTVTAELPLPSVMPSGNYTLRLYCFDAGILIEESSAQLKIEKAGLPRLESELAHEHAAAYGVAAVLVAMVAGIAMGVIFSSKGGGGH